MDSFCVDSNALVFLTGPTAAGKTALAVELVEKHPFEIISVDSALVYRGMNIGTAKPDVETLQRAPHRLVDIVDPAEAYSAARFRSDALREIKQIRANGKIPLLVGGTMLYYRALQFGLSTLPESGPEIRRKLELQRQTDGLSLLFEQLQQIDPLAAERINANDPQRILRALEVYQMTGVPITTLQQEQKAEEIPVQQITMVAISPQDRSLLHQRIELRLQIMMEAGFIEEVQGLKQRGDLTLDNPSMRSVGYRQVWEYLDGLMEREEMLYRATVATRQLAKRQLTWLRNWPTPVHWMEPNQSDAREQIITRVKSMD